MGKNKLKMAVVAVFLLSGIFILSADNNSDLSQASHEGDLVKVKDLISKGANINFESSEGWMPIMYAAENGNFEVIKYFLESGADLELMTKFGISVSGMLFRIACTRGNEELALYIINFDKNIKARDNYGNTALNAAAFSGNVKLLKILIEENGLDANNRNNLGMTILMNAVLGRKLEAIKYLVEEKALDVNAKDNEGNSVLDYFGGLGNPKIEEYLKSKGAK